MQMTTMHEAQSIQDVSGRLQQQAVLHNQPEQRNILLRIVTLQQLTRCTG